jgi:hypothetical protein
MDFCIDCESRLLLSVTTPLDLTSTRPRYDREFPFTRHHASRPYLTVMAKRKRFSGVLSTLLSPPSIPTDSAQAVSTIMPPAPVHRAGTQRSSLPKPANIDSNLETNPRVVNGQETLRTSPDARGSTENFEVGRVTVKKSKAPVPTTPKTKGKVPPSDSSLSDLSNVEESRQLHLLPSQRLPRKITLPKLQKYIIQKLMRRKPTLKRSLLHYHGHHR